MNKNYTLAHALKQISLLCSFFCLTLSAQDEYRDSLWLEIKNAKHDTTLCMAWSDLGEELFNETPDSASVLWQKVIKVANENLKKTDNKVVRGAFLYVLGRAYLNEGHYLQTYTGPDEGLKYFLKALEVNKENHNESAIADCLVSIGHVYSRKGDVLKALDYYHQCLKIHEKINEPNGLAYCLTNLADIYTVQGELENALNYLNRAVKIYEKEKNNQGLALSLSNISSIYNEKGDPNCKESAEVCRTKNKEKALNGFLKVEKLWQESNNPGGVANACLNISSVYRGQGNLAKAYDYGIRALSIYESLKNKRGMSGSSYNLANILLDRGEVRAAEEYGTKSLQLAKELGYPTIVGSAATTLKRVYVKQNNYKAALEMEELSVKMRDSVNNETNRKISIKKQFELEYKLKAENDSIVNAIVTEKEMFKHEQEISQQRLYTYGGGIGFVLMLIVAIVSFRAYKTKQKANVTITQQNAQIEMANKDLRRQHVLNQKIFSVISHDFRGPMLSLNLVLDKFKDSSTDAKLNAYLKDIGTSVHNANTVLTSLLNWAKAEIALESFEESNSLVDEVVEKTEKEFTEKLNEKEIQPVWRIPAGAKIKMPHDILQIAIRNLISNAIKFSNKGGKIEIVYNADETSLVIKDSGVGMSPEKQAQLFNGQVNSGVGTNKEEGFGIGLYIVSELLYKYGFNINVESKLSEGSSFKIVPVR